MAKLTGVKVVAEHIEFEGAEYAKVDREARAGDIVRMDASGYDNYLPEGTFYDIYRVARDGSARILDEDDDELEVDDDFSVFEKVAEPAAPDLVVHNGVTYRKVAREANVGELAYRTRDFVGGRGGTVVKAVRMGAFAPIADDGYSLMSEEYVVLEPVEAAQPPKPPRLKVGEYAKVDQPGHGNHDKVVKVTQNDRKSIAGYVYQTEKLSGESADVHLLSQLVRATDEEVAAAKYALDPRNKFAIGDKVRLISGGSDHPLTGFSNGEIYEVSDPKTTFRSGKRVQITQEGGRKGYALPDQIAKVTEAERKQAEEAAKWAAIGRKVNEYKAGDIVRCVRSCVGHPVGTVGFVVDQPASWCGGKRTAVEFGGNVRDHTGDVELVVPVEQRFDK
ncbi:hypothetical protein [Paenibacillus abyssi]|uniref:Uncharacterized protein n=1 Tax=Paenibacillus abyssi TaxID=1340531 RepID=A0A917FLU3_9BACL|nr:hypothetical protein [Paenibacillus abyssi]GGF88179.1 hypothetical protein GCM10010916_01830 [Paenibacillus abyssi]